jgi:hypothetical protein
MKTIEAIVNTALHTADCDQRCAEADAQFATHFVTLSSEQQAACWRGLDHGAKFRLCVRRIEALGKDWAPSEVEKFISKYDERFAAGPMDAAIEGALERLALEHASAARLADRLGDMAHRKAERAAATAFTNALVQYKAGVRPELLPSGAWLIPSSTPGKPAHIVRMDGDWVCSCAAGANMHWPLALIIGLEGSQDDMERYDDGPEGAADRAAAQLAERLDATAQILDTMRAAQRCDPPAPSPNPLGGDEGDSLPRARDIGQRLAEARRVYLVAA